MIAKITEKAKFIFAPFAQDLRNFYQQLNDPTIPDSELAMEIERKFGERLVRDICLPLGLKDGSCLLVAVAIARGTDTVSVPDCVDVLPAPTFGLTTGLFGGMMFVLFGPLASR